MQIPLLRAALLISLSALVAGCSSEIPASKIAAMERSTVAPAAAAPAAGSEAVSSPSIPAGIPAAHNRKIIYTAQVELVTSELARVQDGLLRLVDSHGGFVASSDTQGVSGQSRVGVWTVRVPSGRYGSFLDGVRKLGEVQRIQSDSDDVTEEFVDLEARLSNKKTEEDRLLRHLRESTAKLSDILAVERELSRVREEVERIEGRLRLLKDQTSLSTVTLTAREVGDYVPESRATFATRAGRTFNSSIGTLGETVQMGALLVIALAPWTLVAALLALSVWLVIKRLARQP
ncbi:MAG: DUF4349 domain-containing protein [Armatimonadota bacterium]